MFIDDVREAMAEDNLYFIFRRDVTVLEDEVIGEGRWDLRKRAVVRLGDETVAVEYSVGATEYQDDTELNAEVYYVKPQEVTRIEWVRSE